MWKLAAAAGSAVLACCLRSSYERNHFVTSVYEVRTEKITGEKTFVFLSDLHDNCFGKGLGELIKAIDLAEPDAVLIGGDMMVVKEGAQLRTTLFLVGQLAKKYPVYYGNGNHESRMDRKRWLYGDKYDVFADRLKDMGCRHLSDASAVMPGGIRISGLNLDRRYYEKRVSDNMEVSYIEKHLGKADQERFQILLAHSPLYQKAYAKWGADLTLSGHFHGGTIRIPGLGGVMTPQFHFFLDCCGGCLKTEGKTMIVSRGLGTHSINIRLNNRPELVTVKVKGN
ncbi:MAG: metallophosphoesterase [Hungatella sp.]|nr:metallophosphoesterase [Hungatella sp.]